MALHDRCRVLVVDDDPTIRRLATAILIDSGKHVQEASNGAEALEWLDRQDFDLVVLDLDMPVMTGREFCQKLQELGKVIPTLILSAYGAAAAARELNAAGSLDKPFDIDEFIELTQSLCALSHGGVREEANRAETMETAGQDG